MLSDRQKSVLFKTRIVSKPRYVRVPLQMYNGVRELKTDVYFPRLLQCNASCPMNGFATCGPMCTA